ncbi:MAG: hypothetical protein P8Z74_16610 [Acidobacteriota bacterium]
MKKSTRIILPLIFLAFVAYIVYTTTTLSQVKCRVCMEFDGNVACRTASGATRKDALDAAKQNACAQLTSGMTNSRICTAREPVNVDWVQ